jgi:Leucine Rich repeat
MAAAEVDWRAELDRVLLEGGEALDLNGKSLGDEGTAEVAEKLRGNSNTVKELWLTNNKIGDGGARSVAELLRSNPPALEMVFLGNNNFGRDGIAALADALQHNTTVGGLNLSSNNLGDGGARAIAELLRSNPPALVEVALGENNIGPEGIVSLADALREDPTVRELYLAGNKGVDPDPQWGGSEAKAAAGIDSLVAAIGVNRTLLKVGVTPGMGSNPHQETIDAALTEHERFLPAVSAEVDRVLREGEEDLNLFDKSLGELEVEGVAEKLRGTSNAIKKLYFGWNEIGDGGARAIAELLRSNPPALEVVNLGANNIGPDGIAALADALCHNTTVRVLWLEGNRGVDPDPQWGGTESEAAAGTDSLVAAIGVNTALGNVFVDSVGSNPVHQETIMAALADKAGRRAGREQFLAELPMTKSAGKRN